MPAPRSTSPRAPSERAALGRRGEQLAAAHLERLGFTVLERNVRTRFGEIDLIASDGRTLAFVEVKTLRASPGGDRSKRPLDWLGTAQRARLRRLATAWLAQPRDGPRARQIRFDAIGVVVDRRGGLLRLDHLEGAW